ncbi:hypothetical protein [Sinanaerobacter sp. ZZT-01]|uniref:hypothetical protein n=1 Tax=Sinanaerobacter sp. ZZT-01 TaxID=3111540 RepID=UPI002D76E26E|nr:hypothetical protein [Sinanaerobacter sp. ZZT-01]WRR92712.1 hypothetical protein U5921_11745 [Sinanaerobacter sp. ZZT-01]
MGRLSYKDAEALVNEIKGYGVNLQLQYGSGVYALNGAVSRGFRSSAEICSFLDGMVTVLRKMK